MNGNQQSLPREIAGTVGGYLAGQVKVAGALACIYSIGYAIAEVPFWFVLGPLCGLLNIIPVFGSVIGLLLTAFAVLMADGTLYNYMGVLITFVVAQALEGFYLTPRLVGRSVGLSSITVFLAVLVGGIAFGPIGVLVAVPVLAVLAILWRRSRQNQRVR